MTKSIEEKLFQQLASATVGLAKYAKLPTPVLQPDEREYKTEWDEGAKLAENIPLLKEAQSLLSEPEDPNPEYDRGICELLAAHLGLPLSNTPLEECGAFKMGVLLDCCTIEDWYKVHTHTPADIKDGVVHGSAFCSEADWVSDSTTDDRSKLTCDVCKAKYIPEVDGV